MHHEIVGQSVGIRAPMLRVLSLGAGVQSTTLLLMALDGEIGWLDCAIFADTGWEPKAVYEHLSFLEEKAQVAGFPIYRVSAGSLREKALRTLKRTGFAVLPLHGRAADGHKTMRRRQCTREYKVTPITKMIRQLLSLQKGQRIPSGTHVEQWYGISLDEAHRMRQNREPWITNVYPLIDRRMRRGDCVAWLISRGYSIPPKSACIACPYHDNKQWRDMKDNRPEEWADAVAFDAELRQYDNSVYIHQRLIPLDQVDLSTSEDYGQLNMFGNECEGLCSV
jgi:hypothetical protein